MYQVGLSVAAVLLVTACAGLRMEEQGADFGPAMSGQDIRDVERIFDKGISTHAVSGVGMTLDETLSHINLIGGEIYRRESVSAPTFFLETWTLYFVKDLGGWIRAWPTGISGGKGFDTLKKLDLVFEVRRCQCLVGFMSKEIDEEPSSFIEIDTYRGFQDGLQALSIYANYAGLVGIADAVDRQGENITREIGNEGDDIEGAINKAPANLVDEAQGTRGSGTITIERNRVTATGRLN